ncbi:hypothetical protein [Pelagibacterium sp.]|uniref:hypothetical protein n=1 Tax=Pelagibacterium sp. TaxID=1967288 RepID=UPI003A8E87E5
MRRPPFPTRVPIPVERPSLFVDALVDHLNEEGDVLVGEGPTAAEPIVPADDGWDDPYGARLVDTSPPATVEVGDDELPAFLFVETFGGKR